MATSIETTGTKIKVIVIDDDHVWCDTVKDISTIALGYTVETSHSLEDAIVKIQEALTQNVPFSVAIVDMHFEVGKIQVRRGKEVIKHIKDNHPYIACIISSGIGLTPADVLDMRDDYGMDYCLPKEEIEVDTLKKSIEKALKRIVSGGSLEQRRHKLSSALEKLQNARATYLENLAELSLREAKQGSLGVDLATMHQIEDHKAKLGELEHQIDSLKLEIIAL